jgi:alpha-beta hydrolase superfamily lysophospholipase
VTDGARPVYFDSGSETLFGWLHAAESAAGLGVVICNPFGYEAVCAHRSVRAFAQTLAAAGLPTLRFDYFGAGDSSGAIQDENLLSRWCDDILSATEFIKRSTGVRRICLIGVRLGALLAELVANRSSVDFLVAVAPVTSGRRYIRELRAFQAAADNRTPEVIVADPALSAGDRGLDVTGFYLSAATVEALERIDLSRLSGRHASAVLILDRDDLPAGKSWASGLQAQAVPTRYEALPGFNEMVSTPHAALVPSSMLEAMRDWLATQARLQEDALEITSPERLPAGARMRIRHDGTELIERAMFIDGERTLFAIATEPAARAVGTETAGHGVIMLNTGATHHIGPNRIYVDLARYWAARGYIVLRIDLAGLGDSNTRDGATANEVYPSGALYDVGVAIDFLRRRRGVRNVTLAGLCAGAYHALRAAISGLPVDAVFLINPLTFYWKPGAALSDLQISEVVVNPGVYAEHARSLRYWLRLFTGKVDLWRVAKVLAGRATLAIDSLAREACRRLGIRIADDLGWDLQSVAQRGIRIVFFFAPTDGGLELLKLQGGSVVERLGSRCRIHLIPGADHTFTQRAARRKLLQLLYDELPSSAPAAG